MRVSICQTEIVWEDKMKNIESARSMIRASSSQNAELVLFPEMSFTGFSMNVALTGEDDGKTLSIMKGLAEENKICVGFGWVRVGAGGRGENHYSVVGENGALMSDYIKIHSFSYADENKYFTQGDNICVFNINGTYASTFICYDLRFPEVFQAVSDTASVIIVAANWPVARKEHWRCLLRARALENQSYVVGINCAGKQNDMLYPGCSGIIDPDGNTLLELGETEEHAVFDIPDKTDLHRKIFPLKKDRRLDLYKELLYEKKGGH